MQGREQFMRKFVESATANSKTLAEGDHKKANKHARILGRLLAAMESGVADRNVLVDLLSDPRVSVRTLAAIDLLRIKHETFRAQQALERLVCLDDSGMETSEKLALMAAHITVEIVERKGIRHPMNR